jgi:hypothetical protein
MNTPNPETIKAERPVSMNDTLPSGNPSRQTVVITLAVVLVGAVVLYFRSSLGF